MNEELRLGAQVDLGADTVRVVGTSPSPTPVLSPCAAAALLRLIEVAAAEASTR